MTTTDPGGDADAGTDTDAGSDLQPRPAVPLPLGLRFVNFVLRLGGDAVKDAGSNTAAADPHLLPVARVVPLPLWVRCLNFVARTGGLASEYVESDDYWRAREERERREREERERKKLEDDQRRV